MLFKTFRTAAGRYLLDTPTGHILAVGGLFERLLPAVLDSPDDAAIARAHGLPAAAVAEVRAEAEALRARGLFAAVEPVRLTPDRRYPRAAVEAAFHGGLRNLALKVTDHCNLACRYCFQHGQERPRGAAAPVHMDRETALAGVERLLEQAPPEAELVISFYGGEPFLNFPLIRAVVEHVAAAWPARTVGYIVTTNGTRVSDAALDFLVRHRFGVLLSLDGPAPVNDRYRVAKRTGRGQYAAAAAFLARLRARDSGYPERSVRLAMTLAPPVDYLRLDDWVGEMGIQPIANLCDQSEFPEAARIPWAAEGLDALFGRYLALVAECHAADGLRDRTRLHRSFASAVFHPLLQTIHRRRVGDPRIALGEMGFCLPGRTKPLLHPDGHFYVCEKVEGLPALRIGDEERGFDAAAAGRVLRRNGRIDLEGCRHCWAVNLCALCYFHTEDAGGLAESRRARYCATQRDNLAQGLVYYATAMERHPEAFAALLGG